MKLSLIYQKGEKRMKNQKGFSLIVLVITMIVLIIILTIVINPSAKVLDDTEKSKELAEASIDNDKIQQIINYELAGTQDLIDIEIDMKRIELSNDITVHNNGNTYGDGWVLYICERDIPKIERKTGNEDFYKSYKDITRSYVVNKNSGTYIRLEYDWKF